MLADRSAISIANSETGQEATWENSVEHSGSLCFADTEEVTGSNPVAPTTIPAGHGVPGVGARGDLLPRRAALGPRAILAAELVWSFRARPLGH